MVFQKTAIFGPSLPSHQGVNDRASTFSVFDPFLRQDPLGLGADGEEVWNLNRFNFRRAHQFLIPQALGYSVGMLNYFFRGSMDASLDTNGNIIIQNTSTEDMNGTFWLYYDDANDIRRPVLLSNCPIQNCGRGLSITHGQTGSLGLLTPPTSPPPKEPGKYILVFEGKLGQEDNAVAGKIVNLVGHKLTISIPMGYGRGAGTVVSTPPGINCYSGGGVCSFIFNSSVVSLTATPLFPSYSNVIWGNGDSGDYCSGFGNTTQITMSDDKYCQVTFASTPNYFFEIYTFAPPTFSISINDDETVKTAITTVSGYSHECHYLICSLGMWDNLEYQPHLTLKLEFKKRYPDELTSPYELNDAQLVITSTDNFDINILHRMKTKCIVSSDIFFDGVDRISGKIQFYDFTSQSMFIVTSYNSNGPYVNGGITLLKYPDTFTSESCENITSE